MNSNNKTTVRLLIEEALNQGNLIVLDRIVHPNYRYTSSTDQMQGIDALKSFILGLRSAFPDLKISIVDQIEEETKVCTRISITGTHLGDFLDIPPTGKKITVQGIVISRLENGLIVEEWELLDQLMLLQQLEIAPV
ncbi:ester cyclase [Pelagicoccus sp. SDUM812002]|uniref:ester cyclase n=1 Tax=Pelagicoccus sp. SDUM812002 TaxID=3041266 RepID=UPI00280C5572|nr:ester cyclase [Pelagicoccus sp. SDUM812002]MDQ8185273.1 ester cyclase [Pelagicoccus sp. SDUM812002]